jgi:hypothetical protein
VQLTHREMIGVNSTYRKCALFVRLTPPPPDSNSICAIHNPSCFSRCLRVPIAMRRSYEPSLWILQKFLLTNPDLHNGLLG